MNIATTTQRLEPLVVLARILGQPGCDCASQLFLQLWKKWKPTRKDLRDEYRRRRKRFGGSRPPIAERQPQRRQYEAWLKNNPITDPQEIEHLQSQFLCCREQFEAETSPRVVDEQEGVVEPHLLSPREVMARALGLPGCDFQQECFQCRKMYIPTKRDLMNECKRRMRIMGVVINRRNSCQFPTLSWRRDALAEGLRSSVTHCKSEAEA